MQRFGGGFVVLGGQATEPVNVADGYVLLLSSIVRLVAGGESSITKRFEGETIGKRCHGMVDVFLDFFVRLVLVDVFSVFSS